MKAIRLGVNLRPLAPTQIGGMENYARNVLEQLLRYSGSEIESVTVFTSARNHHLLLFEDHRVRTVAVPDEGAARKILAELARDRTDALFCPLVTLEPRDALIPSFVTIPDVQHEVYPQFFDPRTLAVLKDIYPASAALASKVFTLSEFSRQGLIRAYHLDPAKVVVVSLDVDRAFRQRYSPADRQEVRRRYQLPDRYVLYPAITWPHKNHPALLKALRRFNAGREPLAAAFTGSPGPGHPAVVHEIRRMQLAPFTFLLGHVPQRDLACLYQDALAMICPSLFEGFGLPILESFHSGCPVICSVTTSCPEVAGDAALYITPEDPDTIVAALERLEQSNAVREGLVAKGYEQAARFSWEETGRRTYDAIRTAVEEAARPAVVDEPWPSITVITPSLNQARFIPETIESVLGQKYPHLEYLVIDGGSTDGTQEILRRYGDRVKWVSEPDRGQADAVNKGVALGHGEIIGWLNSDDTYAPGALERVGRAFARHDDLAVVYGDADHVLENGTRYGSYPTVPFDYERLAQTCFICQPAAFIKKKEFDQVGGLDPALRFCMDYDLWIRMGRRRRFVYLPEVLAQSRLHDAAKTFASRRAVFEEIIATVRRHFGVVPFDWVYGYADHLFNRSPRDVFASKRSSLVAFGASIVMVVWLNRTQPSYWPHCLRQAATRVLGTSITGGRGFRGRWQDGWISHRYVTEIAVSPRCAGILIQGRHHMPGRRPLILSVFVDGVSAGAHVLPKKGPFTIHAPRARPGGGVVTVEIIADRAFRPMYRGVRDARLLSCIIDDVRELM